MKIARIENGIVTNIEIGEPFGDAIACSDDVGIGWTWDGLTFTPPLSPPPVVPQALTARQAKRVLLQAGLLDSVNAAVAAADRETQIDWEYATEMRRDWPTLQAMATALGMTDAQLDDLFIAGSAL